MQKLKIEQNHLQKMQMSLAMRQSLAILQMQISELELWVEEQIENNPLMHRKERPTTRPSFSCDDIAHLPSLFSHLMDQAKQICSDPNKLSIFEYIIGNLEPNGFFLETVTPFSKQEIYDCLKQIQQFDPPGIGAKDVPSCLLLQLEALDKKNSLAYSLIQDHWKDLLQKEFSCLQKKYNISLFQLKSIIENDIASLDPYPGYRFQTNPFPYHFPIDVYLTKEDQRWKIHIPQPHVLIERDYNHIKNLSQEERFFLKTHKTKAQWLISALEKRKNTLHKITSYLVKKQQDYLLGNSPCLVFLTGQEIAKKLNLHESTIARALAEKNLSCPLGVIPLKQLLSKKLAPNVSCDKAKKLLLKIIAEENKEKPLSDSKLLKKMQAMGIPCARRTIAKYRQSLDIPSTRHRKV